MGVMLTHDFHSGLPPYHPLVIAQGYDPVGTDKALRADLASSVQGGYNVRSKVSLLSFLR